MSHHPCNHYCWYLIFFFLSLLINFLKISYTRAPVPWILGTFAPSPLDCCQSQRAQINLHPGSFGTANTRGTTFFKIFLLFVPAAASVLFMHKALGEFFFLLCSFFSCLFFFGSSKVTFLSHLYVHSYFYFIITPFYSFHKLIGKVMFKYQK